jgi:hypothetical protein
MITAKKVALGFLSPLFIFLLFATAFDIGFVKVATHPDTVKRLVAESGMYDSVVPNILHQTQSISTAYGNIPVSDPAIKKAANVALSPRYIQQNTEIVIDNIYDWLDGKIAQPNFKIDLSGAKTLFANNIADSLQKRLSALPACSLAESRNIALSGTYDAYNASCLPRGISPATVAEQVKSGVVNSDSFLNQTSLGSADITNGSNHQSIFDQAGVKNIPAQYQRLKMTPWILSILTVLAAAGIILLSPTWQKGLKHIGVNLLIIGVVMLIFSWAINRTADKDIVSKIKVNDMVLQQDLRTLASDIIQQIDKNYWLFGVIYTAAGALAFGGSWYLAKDRPLGRGPKDKPAKI